MSLWRAAASRLLLRRSPPLSPSTAASSYALLLHARPFTPPPPRPPPAEAEVTPAEARRLVRLVGVEALKRRLRDGRDEVVGYPELLDACVEAGAARTHAEAEALARAMDDAGVVLLFRDKAYLHPEKVTLLKRISFHSVTSLFNPPALLILMAVLLFRIPDSDKVPFTDSVPAYWIWVHIIPRNQLGMELHSHL
jgi:hypothetical protein